MGEEKFPGGELTNWWGTISKQPLMLPGCRRLCLSCGRLAGPTPGKRRKTIKTWELLAPPPHPLPLQLCPWTCHTISSHVNVAVNSIYSKDCGEEKRRGLQGAMYGVWPWKSMVLYCYYYPTLQPKLMVWRKRFIKEGIHSGDSSWAAGNFIWTLRIMLVTQLCLTLCDPTDYSLPGYSVHGLFQARILDWVAISFSRGSSRPRDQTLGVKLSLKTLLILKVQSHLWILGTLIGGVLRLARGWYTVESKQAGRQDLRCRYWTWLPGMTVTTSLLTS